MSVDHKPEDYSEFARIVNAGGDVSNGRINGSINLSRAFGDHQYKCNKKKSRKEQMITAFPDVKVREIDPKDEFLVIACDGIWNCMSNQQVVNYVRKKMKSKKSLAKVCENLCGNCISKLSPLIGDSTGCDNMTSIVVKFDKIGDSSKR